MNKTSIVLISIVIVVAIIGGLALAFTFISDLQPKPTFKRSVAGMTAEQLTANLTLLDGYTPMDDGEITYDELLKEVLSNPAYEKMDDKAWDLLITQRGISHIDDELLQQYIDNCPSELTKLYLQVEENYDKYPTDSQLEKIDTTLTKLEAQKEPLTTNLTAVKTAISDRQKAVILPPSGGVKLGGIDIKPLPLPAPVEPPVIDPEQTTEEEKAAIQEAANKVAAIDGKISEVQAPLQIPSQISECERAIGVIKEKFACAIKEQQFRADGLVKREYIHSTYYMDFTAHSGHLSGTVTFTNGSTTVSGDGSTLFTTEIANNDYIRQSDGTEWYKVTARAANNSCTISPAFQQATHTDDAGASFVSASATQDGTTTSKAFCHLNRYTTDTTRTAGDILKVRANQTNVIAGINISFDEDGTVISYLEIRGCSIADDPFGDASAVKPIFDFGSTSFYMAINSDDYWRLYNLAICRGQFAVYITSKNTIIDSCDIYSNTTYGIGTYTNAHYSEVLNCSLYSNNQANIQFGFGSAYTISNCTFNGGTGTWYAIDVQIAAGGSFQINIKDCTFGVTTQHTTAAIRCGLPLSMRNTIIVDTVPISATQNIMFVTSEDNEQSIGEHKSWLTGGTVTKSATVLRSGGGTSSAYLLPSSVVTVKYPLNIAYGSLNPDFAVWCPASATTVTVYARSNGQWNAYPTIPTNPDDNLILYPSLQATTGWTLVGAGASFASSATQAKYGTQSGRVIRSGTDCYIYYPLTNYPYWSGNITYGCWVYATAADRARIAINDGTTTTYSSYHTGGSTWEWLTVTASVAAGTETVHFRNYVDTGDTTAYFDGAYCEAPIHSQLFLQADYWAGVTATRSQSTKSTQHLWDNNEPSRLADGTQPVLTADAGTGTTSLVDAGLASAVNDYYNGWYLYNVTRSAGAEVTDYDGSTKTITCGTIASQASGDTYYLMNWVGFSTTFTPGTAGWAYLKMNLGLYVSGKGAYIDVKPIISH